MANGEVVSIRKRAYGERFRKLNDIWWIFETLRIYSEIFGLSGVYGEKIKNITVIKHHPRLHKSQYEYNIENIKITINKI